MGSEMCIRDSHVLVSSKIRVENLETVKVGEGDHRAVVAELGIFE